MKKKLEAELISIAHRVLKLKNRSETVRLHEETKKLYDQLTVLRFYEENIAVVENEISLEDLEHKLENPKGSNIVEKPVDKEEFETVLHALDLHLDSEPEFDALENKDIVGELVEEFEDEYIEEKNVAEAEEEEEIIEEMALIHEDDLKQPQSVLFEDVFGSDFEELEFVKVNDVPVEVEQVAELTFEAVEESTPETSEDLFVAEEEKSNEDLFIAKESEVVAEVKEEIIIKKTPEVVFEKPKSLNDRLTKGINIGLNDRIAFEKKLFGGSSDDFNRVLSQLNTFDSFDEAQGFINDFVKPDYNNWDGKEEFENRFLGIVEKKFN
ncbi:hypothetical protein [Flavobacterium sp.]|jgi:hypothetical protein|uniref:hypothetical protein n=1 Tax=Flavobacterium sp. TaxID=239 RepID=UPI002A81734B|nr:hypothetical protein [Flavobacterium sp.]